MTGTSFWFKNPGSTHMVTQEVTNFSMSYISLHFFQTKTLLLIPSFLLTLTSIRTATPNLQCPLMTLLRFAFSSTVVTSPCLIFTMIAHTIGHLMYLAITSLTTFTQPFLAQTTICSSSVTSTGTTPAGKMRQMPTHTTQISSSLPS